MTKLAKLVDESTGKVDVAISNTPDIEYFKNNGFEEMEVEMSPNGDYYLKGKAPAPTAEELNAPILAQIQTIKLELNVPIMKLAVGTDTEKLEAAQALRDYNEQIKTLEGQLL